MYIGTYLPNLLELHLTPYSTVPTVRGLGTSLSQLTVLSLVQCSVRDLDGLPALSTLKELYLQYNFISDVSLVSMLSELEVLNLER